MRMQAEDLKGEEYLDKYIQQIDNFTLFAGWMSKVFHHLDKNYLEYKKLDSTDIVSFKIFKETILRNRSRKVIGTILSEIDRFRNKESVNWILIKKAINSFVSAGYITIFG